MNTPLPHIQAHQSAGPGKQVKDLPALLWGERWKSSHNVILSGPTKMQVRIPCADEAFVKAVSHYPRDLQDTPVDAILGFLKNVGRNWRTKEYVRRRLYVKALQDFKGYSAKMAENEADWIAFMLCSDYRIHDSIVAELGTVHALDEWIPKEETYVRALSRGLALHILPGNVPLSSVVSLLRALVTKNASILKLASEDPFTPIAIAQSFTDVDPNHPVTKAVSVVYWPSDDNPVGRQVAQQSDVLIAWGDTDAIAWARRNAPVQGEVLSFGPKRSFGIVDADADVAEAATACALDASLYDQRACFSLRQVFVHRQIAAPFVQALNTALERFAAMAPNGSHASDDQADVALSALEWQFAGAEVVSTPSWTTVVCEADDVRRHCLGRTVFVHVVDDVSEALAHADASVQTVGTMPWRTGLQLREALGRRGVSRVVELGLHNVFRVGGAHDGVQPLQRLVRWITHETGAQKLVKGINVHIDQTTFLENDRFLEFIP